MLGVPGGAAGGAASWSSWCTMEAEEILALIGSFLTDYFAGASATTFVVAESDDRYVYLFQRGENVYHFAVDVRQAIVEVPGD